MISFSIITVVRNDLNGLLNTYNSLKSQIFTNYEWVVIDGNSSDGTKEFLQNFESNFLNYISESDKGIYDAMNKGINICNNMYILFMNAGDTFYDVNTLNIVYNKLQENNVDVLFGGVNMYFSSNYFYYKQPQDIEKVINYSLPGHHQSTYYSKNIIKQINYDLNFPDSGDYLIIVKMFKYGISTVLLNAPLSIFHVGHTSFKRIFQILYASSKIQIVFLNLSYYKIIISFLKRLVSSIIVILIYNFPFILYLKKNNKK
jgi:putative colanic acid biosynthesis glycosyltransferase